uniref:Uncharacterized protein n=1 Tax=Arundo donax TaxID=35708 RepID=A0A0A9EIX3_ARUDO
MQSASTVQAEDEKNKSTAAPVTGRPHQLAYPPPCCARHSIYATAGVCSTGGEVTEKQRTS